MRRSMRQTYFDRMLTLTQTVGSFSANDILQMTSQGYLTGIATLIRQLVEDGLAEPVGERIGGRLQPVSLYKLRAHVTRLPPRRNAVGQMWTAIRGLKHGFSTRELAAAASTDDVPVTLSAAERYCQQMAGAGVLTRAKHGRRVTYRLVPARNSGPRAPTLGNGVLHDPNIESVNVTGRAA